MESIETTKDKFTEDPTKIILSVAEKLTLKILNTISSPTYFKLFDYLPSPYTDLKLHIELTKMPFERRLKTLQELNLIEINKDEIKLTFIGKSFKRAIRDLKDNLVKDVPKFF